MQINETPFEYSLSGMELGGTRCGMLASRVAYNESVMTLHLSRKQISDHEGYDIARMLLTNNHLRKLELEGNNMGTNSAFALGRVLAKNTGLKSLDLESN